MIYLYHCTKCHHEWETIDHNPIKCSWCKAEGKIIDKHKSSFLAIDELLRIMEEL